MAEAWFLTEDHLLGAFDEIIKILHAFDLKGRHLVAVLVHRPAVEAAAECLVLVRQLVPEGSFALAGLQRIDISLVETLHKIVAVVRTVGLFADLDAHWIVVGVGKAPALIFTT